MSAIDRFLADVTHRVAPGVPGMGRLESDLRNHLRERVAAGESEEAAVARMGTPSDVAIEFLESATPALASPGERLGGFLFDVGLGATAIAVVAALAAWASGRPAGLAGRAAAAAPGIPPGVAIALGATAILLFVGAILYFPVFEALFGQTAGKRLFGTVVAKETGERATLASCALRRIPFAFDIWPIDAVFLFFTARRQRAFDLVAKTIVFRGEGRRAARPWLLVAVVWGIAAALAGLAALASGPFPDG